MVKKVEITGNERISNETIMIFGDVILGKDYEKSDINLLIKKLHETTFFSNISVELINIHTLKPLNKNLPRLMEKFDKVVTVEEHSIIGGLGSIIAEIIAKNYNQALSQQFAESILSDISEIQ